MSILAIVVFKQQKRYRPLMTNTNAHYKYFRIVLTDHDGKSKAIYLYDKNTTSILKRLNSIYDTDYEITKLTELDVLDTRI